MKNVMLLVLFAVAFIQCNSDDPCDNVTCEYNMPCVDGTCECADGLSGVFCEIADRDKFLGFWEGIIQCTPNNEQESLTMDIQQNKDDIHGVEIYVNGSEQPIVGNVVGDELLVADVNVNTGTTTILKASFTVRFMNENTIFFQLESEDFTLNGPIFCNANLTR